MQQNLEPQQPTPSVDAEDISEFYSDDMTIDSGLYTATLTFGEAHASERVQHARIRVSPHMLRAISLLTAKHVREFEERTGGPILLPYDLVHRWGLEEEIR